MRSASALSSELSKFVFSCSSSSSSSISLFANRSYILRNIRWNTTQCQRWWRRYIEQQPSSADTSTAIEVWTTHCISSAAVAVYELVGNEREKERSERV